MSMWNQITEALSPWSPDMLNPDLVKIEMMVLHEGRERKQGVFISREEMPPLLELMQIKAAFSLNGEVDVGALVQQFGGLIVGSLGYTHTEGQHGGGILALESNIPLTCFSLSDPTNFHMFLQVFASAADSIERAIFGTESDRF